MCLSPSAFSMPWFHNSANHSSSLKTERCVSRLSLSVFVPFVSIHLSHMTVIKQAVCVSSWSCFCLEGWWLTSVYKWLCHKAIDDLQNKKKKKNRPCKDPLRGVVLCVLTLWQEFGMLSWNMSVLSLRLHCVVEDDDLIPLPLLPRRCWDWALGLVTG